MGPLELVKLTRLRNRTGGNPEIAIGLIDGPLVRTIAPPLLDAWAAYQLMASAQGGRFAT
jgi:hypothetical protein